MQAGKGPAPRYKGASVGPLRDAAVRQLREVLVTYAILTIQNPDMWGDDVGSWQGLGLLMTMLSRICVFEIVLHCDQCKTHFRAREKKNWTYVRSAHRGVWRQ